ncbi:hypothetical protein [Halochromatium salexigens]|uniref:Uncharacterized protein n=1 Tax=Halochromatium salexigens TaxID=49447 RepID=A0AAJ0XGE5_HALSE|nr:hypothetical protein [Halochromatium salexigens]MBK5931423.1 hypothetical protein [Halochromatium salexigens]
MVARSASASWPPRGKQTLGISLGRTNDCLRTLIARLGEQAGPHLCDSRDSMFLLSPIYWR